MARLPFQLPLAMQASALLADQLRLVDSPRVITLSPALRETTGASGWVTCTVTLSLRLPPDPEQVRVKELVAVSVPEPALPLVARLPDQAPEAVQASASLLDQLSVVADPLATLEDAAERFTVGIGSG